MKTFQSAALVAALGLALLSGCSEQEAPSNTGDPSSEEPASGQIQYVADMTGIT